MNQEEIIEIFAESDDDEESHPGSIEPEQSTAGLHTNATHRFDYALQKNENRENYENKAKLLDYGTNWFPVCGVSAVCFPEQRLPMKFHEDEREIYDRIVGSARANGFVVLFPLDILECKILPHIATLSKVIQANPTTLSLELMGVHRCKVLAYNLEIGEAHAQLLPEVELSPLLPKYLPKYAKNTSDYEKRCLASRVTGYPFLSIPNITMKHIHECLELLGNIIGEEAANQAISRGLTYFSYFAANHAFSNRKTEYNMLKENSANARIATALKYFKVYTGKCSKCGNPIFRNEHIMRLPDQTMTHVNMHGFVHKISLLSKIKNYRRSGIPSYEYTWFSDYAWIIIVCSRCNQHIGWEYISMNCNPRQFYGIQREGITFENGILENDLEENEDQDSEYHHEHSEEE